MQIFAQVHMEKGFATRQANFGHDPTLSSFGLLRSLQTWADCSEVCLCVCLVSWVVCIPGPTRSYPRIQTTEAWAGEGFPGEQPFPPTAKGALPKPTSSFTLRFGSAAGPALCPASLPCNKIVYIMPPSRNKTTESNIANRCGGQSLGSVARCSCECPGRGRSWEAGTLHFWGLYVYVHGGGACPWSGDLGATKGFSETEGGGSGKREGDTAFFHCSFPVCVPACGLSVAPC